MYEDFLKELKHINTNTSYKNKVNVVLKLLENKKIDDASRAIIALIESVGIIVLKKKHAIDVDNFHMSNLAFELQKNNEKDLGEMFLDINGLVNYVIENGGFNEERVKDLIDSLNDILLIISTRYEKFFE